MAYRRKRTYRRKKGKRLSKFMVRAITAVTKKQIETKHVPDTRVWATTLIDTGYISGPSHAMVGNIFSGIARGEDPSVVTTTHQVFGEQFDARGFKFMLDLWSIQAFVPTANNGLDVRFRFTVFKQSGYVNTGAASLPTTANQFDQEYLTTPTIARWDAQTVDVIYQRSFYMNYDGGNNAMIKKKFWVPIKGIKTMTIEQGASGGNIVGQLLGWQYYWALEIFSPGNTNLLTTVEGQIQDAVYFKDA